jgi:hypothetical protein
MKSAYAINFLMPMEYMRKKDTLGEVLEGERLATAKSCISI